MICIYPTSSSAWPRAQEVWWIYLRPACLLSLCPTQRPNGLKMTPPLARFVPSITRSALASHLTSSSAPLHVGQSLTALWPARSSWRISDGLAAIRAAGEHKEVEVEVGKRGRGYLDPDYQRINMGLGEQLN